MKDKIRLVMIFSLCLTILLSCSKQSDINTSVIEKQFSTVVPLTDMNKSLQIVVASDDKSFQLGFDIPLLVYNKSPHSMFFDVNSHIRLLRSTGDRWVDVKNALTYSGTMLLSPQGTPLLDLQYTDARPILDEGNLSASNTDILLRIVVIGEIMEGDTRTGKKVGAYVDVFVKP
jgi:hypothetical protein